MDDGFGVVWSGSVSLLIGFDAKVGSNLARKAHPGTSHASTRPRNGDICRKGLKKRSWTWTKPSTLR